MMLTMTVNNVQWAAATTLLQQAHQIVIVTHVSPDGDAIGSALGLANALQALGKAVTVAVDEGVPTFLAFLPNAALVRPTLDSGDWDLMISTDASDEPRTGKVGEYARAHSGKVINLDHHVTNTLFGDVFLVMPQAVSATEIVFRWLDFMQIPLTRDIALPLLAGLVTDTNGFRISSVTAETLEVAQKLMQAGVSLSEVTARVLDNREYKIVQLWQAALGSVELEGALIHGTITLADIATVKLDKTTDGGLVSFLNQVNEAMVAIVFKEQPENCVEISMRSKPGYDVSAVALSLGGGGHKQAAGATVAGSLTEVKARVLPLLHEAIAKGTLDIR
jgi:phosphoesterase RecJ-like protein